MEMKDMKSERMKFTSFVSFGVVCLFPPHLPSFPAVHAFFIVFLQHGFCDLQDLLKRIDGVAAWS